MDDATLQLTHRDKNYGNVERALGAGSKRRRSSAAETWRDDGLAASSITEDEEQQGNSSSKKVSTGQIKAIKLQKLAGGMLIKVEMTRQPSEPVTFWYIFVDGSHRPGAIWGRMAMSGGSFCRCSSDDDRRRQISHFLGFSSLLLSRQAIPQDSTHAELGSMWVALKKLSWAVARGKLGGGRHVVRLLPDCKTVETTLQPADAVYVPRFMPLQKEMRGLMSGITEYVNAEVMWVPGHQTGTSFWQAGNAEADRRSNVYNLNTAMWLPAEDPAAVPESFKHNGAVNATRHMFELSAVLNKVAREQPTPSSLMDSITSGPPPEDARVLAEVPRVKKPVLFKLPRQKVKDNHCWQHLPGPPHHRSGAAGNPRHKGPPPAQKRPFKRAGISSQQCQSHRPGHYAPRRR